MTLMTRPASARRRLALVSLALVGLAPAVEAFVTYSGTRWPNAAADLRISTVSFPVGSPQLAAAEAAFEDWNRVQGSAFRFTHWSSSQSGATDHGDGVSGVAFSSQVQGGTLGVTYTSDASRVRDAADVLFNNTATWSFDGSPTAREWDFGSTARHEYGHALGLQHSDVGCQALMGSVCGANGVVRRIEADDEAGARYLYPASSSGGSTPPAGTVDWRVSGLGLQPAQVAPGGALTATYTAQNAGTGAAQSLPPRQLVLSTNQTITAQDTVLGQVAQQAGSFAAGATFQGRDAVQVPAGTAPGTYWLGVVIDPQGQVAEANESNNVAIAQLTVSGTPSDWTVVSVTVTPQQVADGDAISVAFTLRNEGGSAQTAPEARVYASENQTISTSDVLLARVPPRTGPFAQGAGYNDTLSVQLRGLAAGTGYVGVLADPEDTTAEGREDNNSLAQAITVAAAPAAQPPPGGTTAPPTGGGAGTTSPAATATTPGGTTTAAQDTRRGGGGGCSLAPARGPGVVPFGLLAVALWLAGARRRTARRGTSPVPEA